MATPATVILFGDLSSHFSRHDDFLVGNHQAIGFDINRAIVVCCGGYRDGLHLAARFDGGGRFFREPKQEKGAHTQRQQDAGRDKFAYRKSQRIL